jgi:hypothetical protein
MGGCIGLPEVVEREILKHMVRLGLEANKQIQSGLDTIRQITGSVRPYSLPTELHLEQGVRDRLTELEKLLLRVPLTPDHAKLALERVISGLPPNSEKNQQCKDSALWEAILEVSRSHTIHFITKDHGFFEGRNPEKGLAGNRLQDCERVGAKLNAYGDLQSCLDAISEKAPPLDPEKIFLAIDKDINRDLRDRAANRGFELTEMLPRKIHYFATEKPDVVSVTFEAAYKLHDVLSPTEDERTEAVLQVNGDCSYRVRDAVASDVRYDVIKYRWFDRDGELHEQRDIFIRVHESLVMSSSLGQ